MSEVLLVRHVDAGVAKPLERRLDATLAHELPQLGAVDARVREQRHYGLVGGDHTRRSSEPRKFSVRQATAFWKASSALASEEGCLIRLRTPVVNRHPWRIMAATLIKAS